MIGKKRLKDIRASINRAAANEGVDIPSWIEEKIVEAKRAKPRNKVEIETLMLIRDGLRCAAPRKRRSQTRP
jgi:hypothetical protein